MDGSKRPDREQSERLVVWASSVGSWEWDDEREKWEWVPISVVLKELIEEDKR